MLKAGSSLKTTRLKTTSVLKDAIASIPRGPGFDPPADIGEMKGRWSWTNSFRKPIKVGTYLSSYDNSSSAKFAYLLLYLIISVSTSTYLVLFNTPVPLI